MNRTNELLLKIALVILVIEPILYFINLKSNYENINMVNLVLFELFNIAILIYGFRDNEKEFVKYGIILTYIVVSFFIPVYLNTEQFKSSDDYAYYSYSIEAYYNMYGIKIRSYQRGLNKTT